MLDQKGNARTATTWQDNHSWRRGHKLITTELADTIPPLYANDGAEDPDAVVSGVKLFSPYNGWRWYVTEWEAETGLCSAWSVQRQLLLPVPSIILAGSPPVSDCAAGPLRCGSWARRIPG